MFLGCSLIHAEESNDPKEDEATPKRIEVKESETKRATTETRKKGDVTQEATSGLSRLELEQEIEADANTYLPQDI